MGTVKDLNGISVLVVDDNATNLHIFKELLQTWGVIPTTCESAANALGLLRLSVNKGVPFDIVLTDLQMPNMDGLGLLRAMREDVELRKIPSVLLSSGEVPESVLADPPYSASLTKPSRPEDLMRAMASALGIWEKFDMNSLRIKVFSHGRNVYATSLNILLVEDMEVNQMVGKGMLTELGHKVTLAGNGQEALNLLKSNPYDVIFMDIQMPVMDGLQATRLIREDPALQHLPIVAMTAYALKGDKEKYLSQDMDAYIAKPIAINELVSVLNGIMMKFNLGAPLEAEELAVTDDIAMETGTVKLSPGTSSEAAGRPGGAQGPAVPEAPALKPEAPVVAAAAASTPTPVAPSEIMPKENAVPPDISARSDFGEKRVEPEAEKSEPALDSVVN